MDFNDRYDVYERRNLNQKEMDTVDIQVSQHGTTSMGEFMEIFLFKEGEERNFRERIRESNLYDKIIFVEVEFGRELAKKSHNESNGKSHILRIGSDNYTFEYLVDDRIERADLYEPIILKLSNPRQDTNYEKR